ncbi:hypothetical protein AC578_7026 [Pseudocercospora eumusae]|uniref:Uncharacterized protein n=1 Tax=Pseudocercospora eumusae TaxID=321146 RepID=A0A139HCL9_9PEZI|nr:hypothetical protein AC578_7026 [Pseudocercospora eumusae]
MYIHYRRPFGRWMLSGMKLPSRRTFYCNALILASPPFHLHNMSTTDLLLKHTYLPTIHDSLKHTSHHTMSTPEADSIDPPRSPLSPTRRATQKLGFGGLPYKPSMSIDSTTLLVNNNKSPSVSSPSSSSSSDDQQITYSPSIYSPQTPQIPSYPVGWEEDPAPAPEPLKIRKHQQHKRGGEGGSFDESSVPKPSDDELERPWGGRRRFMLSHGLKYYDEKDCDLRKRILDQIRELEWQNRINAAREEFFRDLERVRRGGSLG